MSWIITGSAVPSLRHIKRSLDGRVSCPAWNQWWLSSAGSFLFPQFLKHQTEMLWRGGRDSFCSVPSCVVLAGFPGGCG